MFVHSLQKAEAKRLEEEMRKRRERIEKWRHEKKVGKGGEKPPLVILPPSKKWSLEDDEEEDTDEEGGEKDAAEEDLDPLDAYMQVSRFRFKPICRGF